MTDPDLLAKRLAIVETCVQQLRTVVSAEQARTLQAMTGFRNVLVHGYQEVDLGVVRNVVEHHLDDLLTFARIIRERFLTPPPDDAA